MIDRNDQWNLYIKPTKEKWGNVKKLKKNEADFTSKVLWFSYLGLLNVLTNSFLMLFYSDWKYDRNLGRNILIFISDQAFPNIYSLNSIGFIFFFYSMLVFGILFCCYN